MDGLKAALVVFVASLFQLAVLSEYRPFRTSSIVLVVLLSIALLRGSVFGAVAGFGTGLLLDTATLGTASGSAATARRPRATGSTRRSSRSRSSPASTPSGSWRSSSSWASPRRPISSRTRCRSHSCSTCC
jgi:hypothetical protein